MAEIKIEKKNVIWPWIIAGILILAVILYFLFFRNDVDDNATMVQDTTEVMNTNENSSSAVTEFITFVESDTASMGIDHVYTHSALIKLADATQAIADKTSYKEVGNIDKAREYADKITNDPTVTTHGDNIKQATGLLSTTLQNIQQASFPQLNMEAENLKSESQAITTDELTLNQKKNVKSFFDSASVLLKRMN